jgi:hypothetical protein
MLRIIRTKTGLRIQAHGQEAVEAAKEVKILWRKAGKRRCEDLAARYAASLCGRGTYTVERDWMV